VSEFYLRNADAPLHCWHGHQEVYMSLLARADYFVITADRVDAISEACVTGYGPLSGTPLSLTLTLPFLSKI